ncbi:MAG: GNAT family N-acetyltransferase [Clostridia bacterium]|nr:GNAT family N-acetyltransferase [Clostridia bacterium]
MENIILVDYEEKYADDINEMEKAVWGDWGDDIRERVNNKLVLRLAVIENKLLGFGYGTITGDLFHINTIIIKPEYQKQGIGSMIVNSFIQYSINNNIKNILAESVLANGKANSKKLFEKFRFNELYRVENYWGDLYKDVLCTECNNKPCTCTSVVFLKKINYEI